MYRLTADPDMVVCIDSGATIPRGHWMWAVYEQWLAAGHSPAPVPPPYELYSAEHFSTIRSRAWEWMTAWVKARLYDSIETCCSYYNDPVDRYRLEARAMVAWRSAVNVKLEELVSTLPVGIETWDQVRALLPQPDGFDWPAPAALPLGAAVG